MQFKNRSDAGEKLAAKLASYKDKDVIVYAIPRGGVVLGAILAKMLNAPLDLVIVRKVGHPHNSEYAVCVVTEDGTKICNEQEVAQIDQVVLDKLILEQQAEAKRRRQTYLKDRAPTNPKDKTVILIDDGVATGLTFRAALRKLKSLQPAKIIAALPIVPKETVGPIKAEGAEVVALEVADHYQGAVGAYYDEFDQVADEQVIKLLETQA